MKKISLLSLLLMSLLVLGACQQSGNEKSEETTPKKYKIGVVSDRAEEIWNYALQDIEAEGEIEVEIVKFSDFVQPNVALSEGSIDANAYQYYTFLYDYMKDSGDKLYPMGYLSAEPLGIWTINSIKSKEDIPQNAQIAVINDPVNLGNAITMLANEGLLTLRKDSPLIPTEDDIESTYNNLEIIPMEAGAVPRALGDVELILSGSTAANAAGYASEQAMIFQGMDDSNPMMRLNFVVREEDKDNEDLQKILDAYQRKEIIQYANESGNGTFYQAWENDDVPAENMKEYIEFIEKQDEE